MAAITKEKFYKLEGLLTLAKSHNSHLKAIEKAAAEITGDRDGGCGYYGLTSDAVIEGSSASELLDALDIEVVNA